MRITPPHDSIPPFIKVVYPNALWGTPTYDRDSNGLMDLEVQWRDSGSAIDRASLRIVAEQGGVPGIPADSSLVPSWRVVRMDSSGAVLEETVAGLLREGDTRLAVSVRDTAGNLATDWTPVVHLPPGAYQGSINVAGMPSCQFERGVNLALSPDGKKGFIPYNGCVAVFDPDGARPVHFIAAVPNADFGVDISVDSATGLAYIGGGIGGSGYTVLDTRTEQVVSTQSIVQGREVASVKVAGGRLFVGESCTSGTIDVYATVSPALLGQVPVGATSTDGSCANTGSLTLSHAGADGWGRVVSAGVVHFNPATYAVLARFGVDTAYSGWGEARSIRLVSDRWLEVALICNGLEEFDTQPWRLSTRLGNPARAAPCFKELALSPDGTSLFVSADSTGQTYMAPDSVQTPYLFDVPGLRQRYAFPHRRGGTTDAAVWHPDGKRVYMMDEYQVDVYIVRPRPG